MEPTATVVLVVDEEEELVVLLVLVLELLDVVVLSTQLWQALPRAHHDGAHRHASEVLDDHGPRLPGPAAHHRRPPAAGRARRAAHRGARVLRQAAASPEEIAELGDAADVLPVVHRRVARTGRGERRGDVARARDGLWPVTPGHRARGQRKEEGKGDQASRSAHCRPPWRKRFEGLIASDMPGTRTAGPRAQASAKAVTV
jgi:hypothetical protein